MIRTRYLTVYVIFSDGLLLLGALPIERYALRAALSPETSAPIIVALLAVNLLLLLVALTAALASCGIMARVAAYAARKIASRNRHPL